MNVELAMLLKDEVFARAPLPMSEPCPVEGRDEAVELLRGAAPPKRLLSPLNVELKVDLEIGAA